MLATVPATRTAPSQSPVRRRAERGGDEVGQGRRTPAMSCRPSSGSNRRIMGPRPQARRRAAARRSWDGMGSLSSLIRHAAPRPARTRSVLGMKGCVPILGFQGRTFPPPSRGRSSRTGGLEGPEGVAPLDFGRGTIAGAWGRAGGEPPGEGPRLARLGARLPAGPQAPGTFFARDSPKSSGAPGPGRQRAEGRRQKRGIRRDQSPKPGATGGSCHPCPGPFPHGWEEPPAAGGRPRRRSSWNPVQTFSGIVNGERYSRVSRAWPACRR